MNKFEVGDVVKRGDEIFFITEIDNDFRQSLYIENLFAHDFVLPEEVEFLWSTGLTGDSCRVILKLQTMRDRLYKQIVINPENQYESLFEKNLNIVTLAIDQLLADCQLEKPKWRLEQGLRVQTWTDK